MGLTDEMAFRIRSSKYRHVFGSAAKKEHCYECVKITKNAHDSNFCAVNPKFLAVVVECAGGGQFLVIPLEKTGRVDINCAKVVGHRGPVLDIKWNPFNDHVIASASDDATVKLWQIPENGLKGNLTDWLVDLHGHQRRVSFLEWHPTAENILLSAGYDFKCILWNTETAEPINIIDCHKDTIFSISWNRDGSLFATTSKDKKVRVIDPREGTVMAEGNGHLGTKASKVVFLGDRNRLFTTGFSKMSERQYMLWDIKNMSKPLRVDVIDSSSGVLFPFYDHDTNVVFCAGKGDGNIRYFEMVQDAPYCHFLNQYLSSSPQRGLGIMPKRGVDVTRCEIVRFYKLHATKGMVEPISMIVPRKSEIFQEDIYPPAQSTCPSVTADEWISGQNRDPILISLKDGALTQTPTITTYKAVKRGVSYTNSEGSNPDSRQSKRAVTPATQPAVAASLERLPGSLRNIKKLASITLEDDNDTTSVESDTQMESVNDKITIFERGHNMSLSTSVMANNNNENNIQNNATTRRVDKKVWSPVAAPTEVSTNGISAKTDPEKIHVKKVWSPRKQNVPEIPLENGTPKTDPELRKAYFSQLEEIKSLKEQISMKDKRIRQLEEELKTCRTEPSRLTESNC